MKRKTCGLAALGAGLGGVLLGVTIMMTGCSHLKQISAEEFKRQADSRNMQSFYDYQYIGQANDNAYLLRMRAPFIGRKWRQDIYFTPVRELGLDYMPQLEKMKKEREEMFKKLRERNQATTETLNHNTQP
jgi:hypothetical protein